MERALPSGIVTMVFTDIEGSTGTLERLGAQAYAELLATHHRVCREAWSALGGAEVDTAGDAFFVVFERPDEALKAVARAREALDSTGLRVRMGVHTGEVVLTETGYVGMEVHRAARIAAAGHGGQILVSATTAGLVEADELRSLGEHRLKDLAAPEIVYQLGDGAFPPLKTLYRVTLPVPQSSFLGREQEVAEVAALLARNDARLLTLIGPGGTGKTRLALQAAAESAEHFPDGVYWVGLTALRDASLLSSTLARTVGVPETAETSLLETLTARLGGRRMLVLLDNAEHLLPELAQELASLRAAVPTLRLLVTSRERLQLQGEVLYPVPALSEDEAVELFVERAAALGVSVEASRALVELCRRLDRLPLAVELAAARTVLFSAEQLLERLSQRLDLLKGGRDADPRQQTLRATIEWSHELLADTERQLFRRLAVFVGGCTYEAAEEIAGADPDTLQSLLDKSLLRRRDDGEPRYWMLETIREYALDRLEQSGEAEELRKRHAGWFAELAEREGLDDVFGADVLVGALDRLEAEHANVRAILRWAIASGDVDVGLRLAGALDRFWTVRGYFSEARAWLDELLASDGTPSLARVKCLLAAGWFSVEVEDLDRAQHLLETARTVASELGDDARVGEALSLLGGLAAIREDFVASESLLRESVALLRAAGDRHRTILALNNLGCTLLDVDELDGAAAALEEGLALAREDQNAQMTAILLGSAGEAALRRGEAAAARPLLAESLELAHGLGDKRLAGGALEALAEVLVDEGRFEPAVQLWAASERMNEEMDRTTALSPAAREQRERTYARARAALGESGYEKAWAEGRELELEEAVAVALGSPTH